MQINHRISPFLFKLFPDLKTTNRNEMVGAEGIRPEKDGYKVKSIPNKTFRGLQLLAFYYVSWSIAIPEMVSQLGMPYEREYQLAKTVF